MKDLSLRSPVVLAVNIGDTTPTPPFEEYPIVWSSVTNKHMYWDGFQWSSMITAGSDFFVISSESISAGDLVNLYWEVGSASYRARRAQTSAFNTQADGYALSSVGPETGFFMRDIGTFVISPSLASGGQVWLAPNGKVTLTPPTTGLSQQVGFAITDNVVRFHRGTPVFIN